MSAVALGVDQSINIRFGAVIVTFGAVFLLTARRPASKGRSRALRIILLRCSLVVISGMWFASLFRVFGEGFAVFG